MEALVQTNNRGRLSIISCDSGRAFASGLAGALSGIILEADGAAQAVVRDSEEVRFANGETKTVIRESIRGDDVYVVQCIDDPLSSRSVNDNLMALLTAVNAVYQSDPDCITAVIPQFPYSRQDRKRAREPITARVVAAALEDVGAGRIITLDIHAAGDRGLLPARGPREPARLEGDHRGSSSGRFRSNACASWRPTPAGAQMARLYSRALNCDFAVGGQGPRLHEPRQPSRACASSATSRDERVIIPDDMVATGGTLLNSCRLVLDKGASEVYVDLLASVLQRRRRREARSWLSGRSVQDDRRHRRRVAWQRLRPGASVVPGSVADGAVRERDLQHQPAALGREAARPMRRAVSGS